MILLFLKSYFREIAFALIIGIAILAVYNNGYQSGYNNRVEYYEKIRAEDRNILISKIDNLEALSINMSKDVVRKQTKLGKDLNNLTLDIKNNKSFVIKNGECIPSEYFINTFNSVIDRANQK
jgi:basic membrane lipoprotein Med (substrate-binding protein (PBP1-ABC) superfamily)